MKKYMLDGARFNSVNMRDLVNDPELWETKIKYGLICRDFSKTWLAPHDSSIDEFMFIEKAHNITIYLACLIYDHTPYEFECDEHALQESGLDIHDPFNRALYSFRNKGASGGWKRHGPFKLADISVGPYQRIRSLPLRSYFTFN